MAGLVIGAQPALAGDPSDHVRILSLDKARDGSHTVFKVLIQRPADMAALTVEEPYWGSQRIVWPRMPILTAIPSWDHPCYLDYPSDPVWGTRGRLDPLLFYGRCREDATLELTLRYPAEDGAWREVPVVLDLAGAAETGAKESLRQHWAEAQAKWFHLLSQYAGDVGGFFTYASEQTLRKYDLPVDPNSRVRWRQWGPSEERQYAVMTGALAVQESLQLDRMTNTFRDRGERSIAFADIPAVSVKSHPFDEMRGAAKPVHGALAAMVPEDHYLLRFRNVARLLEVLDFSQSWGGSLLRLARPVGTDHGTRERTLGQLCLPDSILSRMLGPAVIREVAVSGSDPYIVNGSDLTVLFDVSAKEVFQTAVDLPFRQARQTHPEAVHDETTYRNVKIERLVSSDRRVSCHRCWIDDVCIYSNSLAALKRTIDAAQGTIRSLARAPDFKYMRAVVFPLDDSVEDGFLYLSDAFIRRVVGPEVRIKQKRRLEAATSLKLLTNAAMFYGYQHGPSHPTMEQLIADGSLHADDLYDPAGGVMTWDAGQDRAKSSTYGDLGFLTPLIEFESDGATAQEADAYGRFRDRYQQYWRQFFDPIGIRIKFDKTITLETCILPLIDASEYNELADTTGGEPITVDVGQFGEDTLLRYVMHFQDGRSKASLKSTFSGLIQTNVATDWLGDWVTFWVEDTDAFRVLARQEYEPERRRGGSSELDVFNASIVLGVHSKNNLSLAAFLVAMRNAINMMAPNTVVFENLEPYHGVTIVKMSPDPNGPIGQELQPPPGNDAQGTGAEGEAAKSEDAGGPAICYATIGDGLFVSTQASALRRVIVTKKRIAEGQAPKPQKEKANALLYIAPRAAELARPTISYVLEQQARDVSWKNLVQVWLLGRCGLLDDRDLDEASRSYLGYRMVCPDGGVYRFDAAAEAAVSSIHGAMLAPTRLEALPAGAPLDKLLNQLEVVTAGVVFTEHGLTTKVSIQRH